MCCEAHANRNRARWNALQGINEPDARVVAARRGQAEAWLERVTSVTMEEWRKIVAETAIYAEWTGEDKADRRFVKMEIEQPTKVEAPVAKELVLA
jgi:hypothetical protein